MTTRSALPIAVRLAVALAGGLVAGVATSYLQGALPGPTNFLANSGAVWTVVAVLLALLAPPRLVAGAVAGLLALVGEVLGYYAIASPLRGIPTTHSERVLWLAAALLVGPLAGAAAHSLRHGRPGQRALAAGGVSGVIAGEGLNALLRLHYTGQGVSELVVAAVVAALAVALGRSAGQRSAAVFATGVVAAIVAVAYAG